MVRGKPGLQQSFPGAPVELRPDLEQLARDLESLIAELSRGTEARRDWLPGIARAEANVGFGQAIRADSSGGTAVRIRLPRPATTDSGRSVAVARLSTSGTVVLLSPAGSRINGGSSISLPTVSGVYVYDCDGTDFWSVRA